VETYGTARQAIDGNIIRRMRFACWTAKATNTHSEYEYLLLLKCNNCCTNTPQYYVIWTLSVLFKNHLSIINYFSLYTFYWGREEILSSSYLQGYESIVQGIHVSGSA
jgi:hypothetical protein